MLFWATETFYPNLVQLKRVTNKFNCKKLKIITMCKPVNAKIKTFSNVHMAVKSFLCEQQVTKEIKQFCMVNIIRNVS